MEYASYEFINEERARVKVTLGASSTPVWFQNRWQSDPDELAQYIVRNGCGHCCAAMALTMRKIPLDPLGEYRLCRSLWGAPEEVVGEDGKKSGQGNFQSAFGIARILRHHGLRAEVYGVGDASAVREHILSALSSGKLVIFCVRPTEPSALNPFSLGYHWVMAVGYCASGGILVANSAEKYAPTGVQEVDIDSIIPALCHGAAPRDMTWGEWSEDFLEGTGYLTVD